MKVKISKTMTLPLLCGVLTAWIVVGGLALLLLSGLPSVSGFALFVAVSGIILLAVVSALRRGAWVYTNARRYHTAEYLYELGNGAEMAVAVDGYEKKVRKAVKAWVKRRLFREAFGVLPLSFFVALLLGTGWVYSLLLVVLLALAVIVAVFLGVLVMLLAARRFCYDRFGNIKNN